MPFIVGWISLISKQNRYFLTKPRQRSFENAFDYFFGGSLALLLVLLAVIALLIKASLLAIITATLIVIVPYCFYALLVKSSIKIPLQELSASLEAVRYEDYSLRAHPKFNTGVIKSLSDEVNLIAEDLRVRKLHYDQQAVLVLNLIEQLATPIAVFDQNGHLNHANDAFSIWCGRPWRQAKHLSAHSLGFIFEDSNHPNSAHTSWKIQDKETAARWQLRYSGFSMQGKSYQLLVLTNIEKVVNEAEQLAWQKMTRVLSHEINNSLSPIKSLAQSLVDVFSQQSDDEAAIEALQVIASRSDNLMQFVNRYASLNQQFDVNIEQLQLSVLLDDVTALFDHNIIIEGCNIMVNADTVLLEQILINLIKNSIEASPHSSPVKVNASQNDKMTKIVIEDYGTGIANPDNLFVPFYTTKDKGKGIGLAISRNMVEQQGGRLTLQNKERGQGAQAVIRFGSASLTRNTSIL